MPGLIAASVWRKSWFTTSGSSSICRPRALMIPWLTECISPNGLPSAITQVPTRGLIAVSQPRRRQVVAVKLSTAMSASPSFQTLTGKIAAVAARSTRISGRLRAVDHVMIGQDVKSRGTVASDDHARAGFLEMRRARRFSSGRGDLLCDNVHHGGRNRLGDQLESAVHLVELLVLLRQRVINCVVGQLCWRVGDFDGEPAATSAAAGCDAGCARRPERNRPGRLAPGTSPARFPQTATSMKR